MSGDAELTKDKIETAFDLMARAAIERGIVIELAVFGGSCLVLATNVRLASGDIDAVFLKERTAALEICDAIADRLGMPRSWLNEAVKSFAPPRGNPPPSLLPFGEFPRDTSRGIGLRVLLPTPEYMLAMKILANRFDDDQRKVESDQGDSVALMKIVGLTTVEDLKALLRTCYPMLPGLESGDAFNARLLAKVETLVDAYEKSRSDHMPTWNAGRGRPTEQK